jgi:hypothetical protein
VVIAEEVLTSSAACGADDAPLIQTAVDRVAKAGGGTVFLSSRVYDCVAHRRARRRDAAGDREYPAKGTLLRITADRGNEKAPAAFSMERGSGLMG